MSTLQTLLRNRIIKNDWLIWLFGLLIIGHLLSMMDDPFKGLLPGNDDLMRLQQIRDLLAGQSWFDVSQTRMVSPEAGAMHWSRLVDLPIAALILLLSPVLGSTFAESFAIIAWPILLAVGCIATIVQIVERMGLSRLAQACALGCFLGTAGPGNFMPGRIDHHGLLIFLTLLGFAALISPTRSRRSAVLLGLSIVLLSAIALEGLVYAVVLIGLLGVSWVFVGHQEAERMVVLGATLFLLAPVAYALDAPGLARAVEYCDAYALPHLIALSFGGAFYVALGAFGSHFLNRLSRLSLGLCAGVLTAAIFSLIPPGCIGDPYAALPDSVREMWLQNVMEAKSFAQVFETDISAAISQYGFLFAGIVAAAILALRADKAECLPRFLLLVSLVAMSAISAWQIRGMSFGAVFAAIAAGGLAGTLIADWWSTRGPEKAALAFAGVLLLPPGSWSAFGERLSAPSQTPAPPETRDSCRDPVFFRSLPRSGVMTIFAPVDLGTSILAHSPHLVFAGPYHRNPKAIETIGTVFALSPEDARLELKRLDADHVLFCKGLSETNHYVKAAEGSLAAGLDAGQVPNWLSAVTKSTGEIGEPILYEIIDRGMGD